MTAAEVRHDWTDAEIAALFRLPLLDLVYRAQDVHRRHNPANRVQLATLLSVKTGGCAENCAYCPQSAHHDTFVEKSTVDADAVLAAANRARDAGASRFCMGWAWREIKDGKAFDEMLGMVRGVRDAGLEPCVTAGMLNADQARRLKDAGLAAYNHNLDTSPEFYNHIVTTRTYDERLATIDHVRAAGLSVCCGGIIGMGEDDDDRAQMLRVLATMDPHPESVPVNALVAVAGTPLANQPAVDPLALVRMIAVTRIVMPRARVRLSAGRSALTREAQVLCFLAGANSIFYGDKLLTTGNNDTTADLQLLRDIGAQVLEPGIEDRSDLRVAR